jgi:uncharacterized membrane protein YeaQ/YmgE (transglycosylase-associated protein family)
MYANWYRKCLFIDRNEVLMPWMIVIGVVVGIGTMMVIPERNPVGSIVAIVVGIAGSVVPAVLGSAEGWYHLGDTLAILTSVGGAIALSVTYLTLLMRELHAEAPRQKHAGH